MTTTITSASQLPTWRYDNRFVRELAGDSDTSVRPRQVFEAAYSNVEPTPVAGPQMLAWSAEMASELGLDDQQMQSAEMAEVLAGNRLLTGMQPFAACYGGHQFGHWAGQLGDGRAITLAEVAGRNGRPWELQLKGAGPTPYSRTADGRAVLRSSVREFLCSEAMHHLGVPTTRALSLVTTGDQVMRDMFYDGNAAYEPGAVVCRVAPSFLRFGNFEIFASRRDTDNLQRLAEFTVRNYFPELGEPGPDAYVRLLREVSQRTAVMITHWMRVGFVHGVMNTDNMSILGLTIDYGPYGWLEPYDPMWTPNTTDAEGRRYAFGRQPEIAAWNLVRFAEALYPLVEDAKPLEEALQSYTRTLDHAQEQQIADKLGLANFRSPDAQLFSDLLQIFRHTETDMTIFFRQLAEVSADVEQPETANEVQLCEPLAGAFYDAEVYAETTRPKLSEWLRRYIQRVQKDGTSDAERRQRMNRVNPKFVLRNYLAQLAIDQATDGDPAMIHQLLDVLRTPYDEHPEHEDWAAKRPEWARHKAGCSMLSCSS